MRRIDYCITFCVKWPPRPPAPFWLLLLLWELCFLLKEKERKKKKEEEEMKKRTRQKGITFWYLGVNNFMDTTAHFKTTDSPTAKVHTDTLWFKLTWTKELLIYLFCELGFSVTRIDHTRQWQPRSSCVLVNL